MKTKYLYAIGIALAVAVIIFAGVKHFVPSAVSESTSLSSFVSETFCTVSSTVELTTQLFNETKPTETSSSAAEKSSAATNKTTTEKVTTKKEETSTSTAPFQLSIPEIKIPTLPFPTTTAPSTSAVSENQEVDLSCFDNTAFVGNSRFISFKNYGLAKNVYPVVGLNVDTVFTKSVAGSNVPVIDELNGKDFDKVILLFGDNECGWPNTDVFISRYAKVVAAVRERVPNAEIYLHAILPVSTEASNKNEFGVNNDRIRQVNEKIKQLAADEGIHYIEQPACLMDSNNALLPAAASDGIHLNKKYSEIWIKDLAVTIF